MPTGGRENCGEPTDGGQCAACLGLDSEGEPIKPAGCGCMFSDPWRCAVQQRLTMEIACKCPCHASRRK